MTQIKGFGILLVGETKQQKRLIDAFEQTDRVLFEQVCKAAAALDRTFHRRAALDFEEVDEADPDNRNDGQAKQGRRTQQGPQKLEQTRGCHGGQDQPKILIFD
jgi:hypothetical protein